MTLLCHRGHVALHGRPDVGSEHTGGDGHRHVCRVSAAGADAPLAYGWLVTDAVRVWAPGMWQLSVPPRFTG